jgi:3-dehydroquinate dehydratase type I
LKRIKEAGKHNPDFIEIRMDTFESYDGLSKIVKATKIPLIATNRLVEEGGLFKGDEKKRIKTLMDAARLGFEFIDIELSVKNVAKITNKIHSLGSKVIISYHDFNRTPSTNEIQRIFEKELSNGADVCKLVTTAHKFSDNLGLLNFINNNYDEARIVCFAMGKFGRISRLVSPLFGAFFTMASIEKGKETGPGQLEIGEMRELYEKLGLSI